MADDFGFQPIQQPSSNDDFGFQPIPEMPDTSGVQKMAKDNLAANDDKESEEIKAPQSPSQRLDTAIGMPVNNLLNPDDDVPLPSAVRKNLTKAYSSGHADDAGDFMQSALHSVLPIVARGLESFEALGAGIGQGYDESRLFPVNPYSNVETIAATAANIPFQGFGAAYKGFQNVAVQAGQQFGFPALGRDIALFPESMMGADGMHPSVGPWDSLPGHEAIREPIAKSLGKSPESVSSADIDHAISNGVKNKAPSASDFKAVETVTDGALPEKTLHIIYNETGVKPDQVFADAQRSAEVAKDISAGKIPQQYEHLVEPKVFAPESTDSFQVVRDDASRSFTVLDKDGDHVQGGFDSAQEARHYIEDEKFKAEERAAIEEEGKSAKQDVLTPESERALAEKSPVDNIYSNLSDKIENLTEEQANLRLQLLNKKMEAGIITPKEMGEREFLSEKTSAGDQTIIPGTEKITDKQLAERKMNEPLRGGDKPLETGLFDVASRSQQDLFSKKPNIIPPSETGKPTSLRSFLSNNGAKFNEGNELLSIKKDGKIIKGGAALDHANEIAKEHGYIAKEATETDLANLITEKNGGREAWRDKDSDRVLRAAENKKARENLDPSKIEHEAHNIGIDTDRLKGESDKQYLDRLTNALREFYKSEEGFGITFRDAIGRTIVAAEKFTGKLSGGFFEKLGEAYIRTFQPELVGPLAKRADAFLAKYKAAAQEAENSFYQQSAISKKRFDRMSDDERMEWLYDHETGRWNEEENPDHARFQAIFDAMHKAEKEAIGSETAYKENYLPHQWEKPDAVKAFFKSDVMIKKYGSDWFKKASEFRLIQEGVRAGFKLKTNNPESMLLARQLASDNMIRAMDLLKDMEGSGVAKKTISFSLDKKIAKTEAAIKEVEKKYKEAFEKKNPPDQKRAEGIAPATSKSMQVLKARLDDLNSRLEGFNKEKDANTLTPDQMKVLKDGFRIIGPDSHAWNIAQEVGPLWKNVMESKGLWDDQGWKGDSYRTYMQGKAIWVSNKLALSLFHPSHMLGIHLSSGGATALEHIIYGGSIKDLDFGKTSLRFGFGGKDTGANPFVRNKDATLGFGRDHPAVVAWNTPREMRTPEQQKIVSTMVEGGFKPTMSAQDAVHFKENWDKAINGLGVNNLRLITASTQALGGLSAPVFQSWIPALKSESYLYRADLAMKRDPSLVNDAGKRGEVLRQIAKDVDRNYGEMNQDTLFWNKTVRDAFNASMLSGGWKLAMIQNFRGLAEPTKVAYNFAKTGEFSKEQITHQMLQSYIYTGVMLAQGAIITKLLTGAVDGAISWAFPNTGDKNPDGSEIRLQQPAFLKEGFMLNRDINEDGIFSGTARFLYHQTLIPGIADTLNNRDFVGRKIISDPTDLDQWASAGWDSVNPITISALDVADKKGSKVAKTMGILGFPLAGQYVNQTAFEQKVLHAYSEQNPPKGDVYSTKLKNQLKAAMAKGEFEDVEMIKQKMHERGMTDSQISSAAKTYTTPFVNVAWSKLSSQDQKRLIESATEEERAKFKVKNP